MTTPLMAECDNCGFGIPEGMSHCPACGYRDEGPPTTEARFDGKCSGCGEPIRESDVIYRVEGDWVCEDCKERA